MNKNNNIIVINNKRYDAKTGALLSHHSPHTLHSETPVQAVPRKPAPHAKAHAPRHSRTLMRQAVKRPPASLKRHIKVQGRIDSPASRQLVGSRGAEASLKQLDARLLAYAQRMKESAGISHFSSTASDVISYTPPGQTRQPEPLQTVQAALTAKQSHPRRKPQTTAELLDYALQHATSHEQQPPQQGRRHLFKKRAVI